MKIQSKNSELNSPIIRKYLYERIGRVGSDLLFPLYSEFNEPDALRCSLRLHLKGAIFIFTARSNTVPLYQSEISPPQKKTNQDASLNASFILKRSSEK